MTHDASVRDSHPAPRFPSAWAALTYAACAVALAWPVLQGRFLVNVNSDQFRAGYAFREFAASYMKETGDFPLWNPFLQGGMPYVAAMHGDIFYPTFLLRLVMPVDLAMSWGMIGHFFLCGMATYWFLRAAGRMSFFGALIGGLAFMMTGFVSSLVSAGHDGKLFVNALFPLTLLVLTWGMRDGKRWAWGVLAIVVGLGVLTPHPQLFQYLLLGCAAWALFLAFGKGPDALDRATALKRLGIALGAVLIGGAIGAIQFLPVAEYAAWSPRAGGRDYDFATTFSFPLEELFNLYLPQFSGLLNDYWGRNFIHFHSEYAGVAVLMLAGAAFGASTSDARRRFFRFWIGVAVVSLLWALGGSTPFYRVVYALVPGSKFFRAPSTIFFITAFAIAVFAAIGAERALERRITRRYLIGWVVGGLVVALLAWSGALTSLAHSLVQVPQFADRVDAGAGALKLGALRSLLFVGLTAAVLLAVGAGRMRGWQAGSLIAVICAVDLWTIERRYWGSSPPAAEVFASDPAIDYLKQLPQPVRVFAPVDNSMPVGDAEPNLHWDGLMVHRIRNTYGYHGNQIGRYQLFEQDEMMFNPTTWALTNTKYLMVNNDSVEIPGGRKVVGPVRNAAGTNITLYELPGDNPFAWVVPVIAKYPEREVIGAIRTPNFPVRSVALVDESSSVQGTTLTAIPAPLPVSVTTTSYEPGRVTLALSGNVPAGAALVVSENYYPGWVATVDDAPVPVERVNHVLIGVPLPPGARSVTLTFTSPPFERGRSITLAALLVSVVAAVGGAVRPGRPTARAGDATLGADAGRHA